MYTKKNLKRMFKQKLTDALFIIANKEETTQMSNWRMGKQVV